jgi:hypothetical protein
MSRHERDARASWGGIFNSLTSFYTTITNFDTLQPVYFISTKKATVVALLKLFLIDFNV